MKKLLTALLLLALLAAAGCLGPKPVLEGQPTVQMPPKGSDQPVRVDAVIANRGPGEGQVVVEVSLSDKTSGQIIAKESKEIELQTDETQHVLFEVQLPPSAEELDRENIKVEVDAHYPIQ